MRSATPPSIATSNSPRSKKVILYDRALATNTHNYHGRNDQTKKSGKVASRGRVNVCDPCQSEYDADSQNDYIQPQPWWEGRNLAIWVQDESQVRA